MNTARNIGVRRLVLAIAVTSALMTTACGSDDGDMTEWEREQAGRNAPIEKYIDYVRETHPPGEDWDNYLANYRMSMDAGEDVCEAIDTGIIERREDAVNFLTAEVRVIRYPMSVVDVYVDGAAQHLCPRKVLNLDW